MTSLFFGMVRRIVRLNRASGGCWRLVDWVPSGLAPLGAASVATDPESGTWNGATPDKVTGQRVEFCLGDRTSYTLAYNARVVAPGTFAWEPAVLQKTDNPGQGLAVPAATIAIASKVPGKASTISIDRLITLSIQRPA